MGDRNGFIRIRLKDNLPNKYTLAYKKIARELPKWKEKFSEEEYRKALISITEYMGKVPKLPNQIIGIKEADIPYRANYDRLAKIIHELGQEYNQEN